MRIFVQVKYLHAGTSYCPTHKVQYHRINTLSLLCSEWDEVVHVLIKHRHVNIQYFDFVASRVEQIDLLVLLGCLRYF